MRRLLIAVLVAAAAVLVAAAIDAVVGVRAQVALQRLDCVSQPSTRLLVNDTGAWATYVFDASFGLNTPNLPVYEVRVAPGQRLVVCVG